MRTEEECPKVSRFLFADAYLSDQAIKACKNAIIKRFENREKDEHYLDFIAWERGTNEIAVFTLYAYADLEVPKEFDCVFNFDDPFDFVNEKFVLTKSAYEGWLPSKTIDDGHKHLVILTFKNEIPDIFFKLHKQNAISDGPDNCFRLGICNMENFPKIRDYFIVQNALKKQYGKDWWKYRDEDF